MKLKQGWMGVVLIALLASTTMTGCGTFGKIFGGIGGIFTPNHQNDLGQWQVRTEKEAQAYNKARYMVVELLPDGTDQRRRGVMTDLQYAEFNTFEKNVAAAEELLNKDFKTWTESGTKPADFDGRAKTLREQQQKLINLVKVVKP